MDFTPLQRIGEWLPDRAPFENAGAIDVKNCRPVGQDYAPIQDLVAQTDELPANCRGSVSIKASDGTVYTFAGTDTALYRRIVSSCEDVSRAEGYNGTSSVRWRFVQYGNYVMACNGVDAMQAFQAGVTTDFADVPNAPVCRFLTVINNFVVASNIVGDETLIKWSALDNPMDWVASPATQSDSQPFYEAGTVTAVVGSQNSGVIVGTQGIGLMEFVGGAFIFTLRLMEPNRGSKILGSVVGYSNGVFYRGEDGFYFFNGSQSTAIGYEKVDDWFTMGGGDLAGTYAALDPRYNLVMFGVPGPDINYCPKTLIYSPTANRWGYFERDIAVIVQNLTESVNVDDLPLVNVDDVNLYLDDPIYAGGRQVLSAFGTDNRLASFSGDVLPATIETTEYQPNPNGRCYVDSVMLMGEYETASIKLKMRNLQTGTVVETDTETFEPQTGEAPVMVDARFIRAVITLTRWTRAQGIKAKIRSTGRV